MPTQSYATHSHRPIAWNIVWLICFVAVVAAFLALMIGTKGRESSPMPA